MRQSRDSKKIFSFNLANNKQLIIKRNNKRPWHLLLKRIPCNIKRRKRKLSASKKRFSCNFLILILTIKTGSKKKKLLKKVFIPIHTIRISKRFSIKN